jgi:hypothetical protein
MNTGCAAAAQKLLSLKNCRWKWRGHDAEGVWNADCIRSEAREVGVSCCAMAWFFEQMIKSATLGTLPSTSSS